MERYMKAIVAASTVALETAQTVLPMPASSHGYLTVALAFVGALGVYFVPNAPPPPEPKP